MAVILHRESDYEGGGYIVSREDHFDLEHNYEQFHRGGSVVLHH